MAYSRVQAWKATSAVGSAVAITAASTSPLTAGNRLLMFTSSTGSGAGNVDIATPVQSAGTAVISAFTQLVSANYSTNHVFVDLWTATVTTGGTCTLSATTASNVLAELGWSAAEYSGLDTSAGSGCLDKSAVGVGATASSIATGTTAATTAANQLGLCMVGDDGETDTWTLSTANGFAKVAALSVDADANTGIGVAEKTSASGATESATWTAGTNGSIDAWVAVIKLGSATATSPQTPAQAPAFHIGAGPSFQPTVSYDWTGATAPPVTAQALPPQTPRPVQRPAWLRFKGRKAEPAPAQQTPYHQQPLPPQQPPTPRRWLFTPPRRRAVASAPSAPVVVVAVQAQPAARRRFLPRRRPFVAAPPVTVAVTVPAVPARRGLFRPLRRRYAAAPPPVTVTVAVPAVAAPRRPRLAARRAFTANPPPSVAVTVTTQALPPQQPRPAQRPAWLRARGRQAVPAPAQQTPYHVQLLPPQPATTRRFYRIRARARAATPPTAAVVVTVQALPPQQPPGRRLFQPRAKARTGQPVPAQVVVVTAQALPPQQPTRRRLFQPRAKARSGQPVPAQVVVQTTQALPPQQPARRRLFQPKARARTAGPALPLQQPTTQFLVAQQPPRRRLFQPRARPRQAQPVPAQVVIPHPIPPQQFPRHHRLFFWRRGKTRTSALIQPPPPFTVGFLVGVSSPQATETGGAAGAVAAQTSARGTTSPQTTEAGAASGGDAAQTSVKGADAAQTGTTGGSL